MNILRRVSAAAAAGAAAGLLILGTADVGFAAPTVAPDGTCPPGIAKHKPWLCPSPSPSPSPSGSPTATPSPSPSPTVTAPPVTTTPPPSPSPTGPVSNCMPDPSRCGWPDADNTGTIGPLTLVQGDVTLATPGMVYENRDVRGCISIRAKNITIRNVRVTCSSWYGIGIQSGTGTDPWVDPLADLLVEDSEINLGGSWTVKGIAFDGYTARRVHFYGGSDCAHFGANVTIEDSFCDIPAGGPADGPHYDGFQSDGGANIVLRHNTIRVPYSQTSAILMSTNTSPIRDVWIQNNLVAGGGYTIYCAAIPPGWTSPRPVDGTFVLSGNRFARTYFPLSGRYGPIVYCDGRVGLGNVWDDTGVPI